MNQPRRMSSFMEMALLVLLSQWAGSWRLGSCLLGASFGIICSFIYCLGILTRRTSSQVKSSQCPLRAPCAPPPSACRRTRTQRARAGALAPLGRRARAALRGHPPRLPALSNSWRYYTLRPSCCASARSTTSCPTSKTRTGAEQRRAGARTLRINVHLALDAPARRPRHALQPQGALSRLLG